MAPVHAERAGANRNYRNMRNRSRKARGVEELACHRGDSTGSSHARRSGCCEYWDAQERAASRPYAPPSVVSTKLWEARECAIRAAAAEAVRRLAREAGRQACSLHSCVHDRGHGRQGTGRTAEHRQCT